MSRGGCSVWHRGVRLWTVALVLGAMLLALASVAVAVAAEDGQPSGHVMPAFGSVAGGTSVTISGSGFTGATGVTFGGVAATNVTVNGDGTAITATTPAHDTGAAPVVVTKADGTTVTVGGFFFIPATTATSVTVSGVTPATGSTGGHTPVVINGTGFREGAQVTFGTAAATEVHVFAGQIITVLTPAHDLGAVAVTVTNPSGQSGSLDAVYTYVTPPPAPAPTITRIDPATAPASSLSPTSTALDDHHGQIVAITGTGFQPNAAVTFGGTPVDHATTLGDTVILTTPPDHAVGKVDVVVTNPDNGSATLTKGFEYVGPTPGAPPAITAIDPATGTAGAHQFTVVTITGTGFQHDATVKFGSVAAHDIVVVSDSTIITFAPPHDAGAVDVVVTNHDGQSATSPVQFIYTAPAPGAKPTVTKIDPPSGSTTGEHDFNFITITGTGFARGATVTFGDIAAGHAEVIGGTSIIAQPPNHAAGTVDITVTNPDGQSGTLSPGYTYIAPLAVTAVAPNTGTSAGGDSVTITGTGFQPNASVRFDGIPATNVAVGADGTSLTATTPAHPAGEANLYVINPNGQTGGLHEAFTFTGGVTPPPTAAALAISEVERSVGPVAGGSRVAVSGAGFTDGVTVTFDSVAGADVEIVSSTLLRVTTPAHAIGTVDVTVTNAAGVSSTLTKGYSYLGTTPDHRSPVTTSTTGDPPPAPLPTGGRKNPGAPNTPGIAGAASVDTPSPNPTPPHR